MIVTRKIINPKIQFFDISTVNRTQYSYNDLCQLIDAYKNILQYKFGCKSGQSAIIGITAKLKQVAAIIACAELGLSIVIADYNRVDAWEDSDYIDPKTRLLMPIDFFIIESKNLIDKRNKYQVFNKICSTIVEVNNQKLDFTPNENILSDASCEIIRCTSSGTTGTPKVVTHSHEFMYNLIKRNSKTFYGKAGLFLNLQHGSSFATYFFPILASENVTDFFNFNPTTEIEQTLRLISLYNLDHLMIPYPFLIDQFFKSCVKVNDNLNIYTLSYIQSHWIEHIKKTRAKNVISIFGSNETSGPVFLNQLVPYNQFQSNKFFKVDDFYDLSFDQHGVISIKLPHYENITICTNDIFKYENGYYFHQGRSDLIRINGVEVNLKEYHTFASKMLNCEFVYDSIEHKIYLAVWQSDEELQDKISNINLYLKQKSNDRHFISKHAILNQDALIRGVKVDQELLRDYFRNYV